MRSTREELVSFAQSRSRLASELLLCLPTAAALLLIAPHVDGAGPEPQALFLGAFLIFGALVLRLTPRLIPVLMFRCPRCTHRFHAASRGPRPALTLRRCAHCGIALPRPGRP